MCGGRGLQERQITIMCHLGGVHRSSWWLFSANRISPMNHQQLHTNPFCNQLANSRNCHPIHGGKECPKSQERPKAQFHSTYSVMCVCVRASPWECGSDNPCHELFLSFLVEFYRIKEANVDRSDSGHDRRDGNRWKSEGSNGLEWG